MFVRWQRRPRLDGDASLVAYLLEIGEFGIDN